MLVSMPAWIMTETLHVTLLERSEQGSSVLITRMPFNINSNINDPEPMRFAVVARFNGDTVTINGEEADLGPQLELLIELANTVLLAPDPRPGSAVTTYLEG